MIRKKLKKYNQRARYTYYQPHKEVKKTSKRHYLGDVLDESSHKLEKGIRKRLGRISEIVLLGLLTLFLILFFKKQSAFLLFVAITGYVKYLQTKMGSPIDVSPLFFFTTMVAAYYGVFNAFLFIIIADFIPFLLGGGVLAFVGFPTYALYFGLAIVGSLSPATLIYVGVVLSVLNALGCMVVNKVCGNLQSLTFFNVVLHMFLNIFYFVKVAPLLMTMLS